MATANNGFAVRIVISLFFLTYMRFVKEHNMTQVLLARGLHSITYRLYGEIAIQSTKCDYFSHVSTNQSIQIYDFPLRIVDDLLLFS